MTRGKQGEGRRTEKKEVIQREHKKEEEHDTMNVNREEKDENRREDRTDY
jgi:hypothetical protein